MPTNQHRGESRRSRRFGRVPKLLMSGGNCTHKARVNARLKGESAGTRWKLAEQPVVEA